MVMQSAEVSEKLSVFIAGADAMSSHNVLPVGVISHGGFQVSHNDHHISSSCAVMQILQGTVASSFSSSYTTFIGPQHWMTVIFLPFAVNRSNMNRGDRFHLPFISAFVASIDTSSATLYL